MAKHASSSSKIVLLVVLILLGLVFWRFSPLFLPRYRWTNVDFAKIASQQATKGVTVAVADLQKQFDVEFAFDPRHRTPGADPHPWVLIKMTPPWHEHTGNPADSEEGLAKRVVLISDRTGEPPGGILLGSGQYKDKFFRGKAWRLPPGSLGFTGDWPVILVDMMALEKFDIGEAQVKSGELRNPKLYEADEDGFDPASVEVVEEPAPVAP